MRWSEVLLSFYGIRLAQLHADEVDSYFTLSSHHLRRYEQAQELRNLAAQQFHHARHFAAMMAMVDAVQSLGDFSKARDADGRGLHRQANWSHLSVINGVIDLGIFDEMDANPYFGIGEAHPSDVYILSLLEDLLFQLPKSA